MKNQIDSDGADGESDDGAYYYVACGTPNLQMKSNENACVWSSYDALINLHPRMNLIQNICASFSYVFSSLPSFVHHRRLTTHLMELVQNAFVF